MKKLMILIAAGGFLSPQLSADTPPEAVAIRNLSPDQAEKLIQESPEPGLIIVDVRTSEEFEQGHIKGAVNIDFFDPDFEKKVKTLDRKKAIMLHCASGHRSAQAVDLLRNSKAFPQIYHLKDGFSGWKAAKKSVEK